MNMIHIFSIITNENKVFNYKGHSEALTETHQSSILFQYASFMYMTKFWKRISFVVSNKFSNHPTL